MSQRRIELVVVDVRSAYNVGAILRTADAMAVDAVHLVGITPYPSLPGDQRLPHVAAKADWEIHKTALGAERSLAIKHYEKTGLGQLFNKLRQSGLEIVALEQAPKATRLNKYSQSQPIALVLGNEVKGLNPKVLKLCDRALAIPMLGQKESLNVSVAAGIALYHLRFSGQT